MLRESYLYALLIATIFKNLLPPTPPPPDHCYSIKADLQAQIYERNEASGMSSEVLREQNNKKKHTHTQNLISPWNTCFHARTTIKRITKAYAGAFAELLPHPICICRMARVVMGRRSCSTPAGFVPFCVIRSFTISTHLFE